MSYLEKHRENDPVCPGEQWFCYWKTSAALWEGRIREFSADQTISIPLYWGLHAEAGGEWDFGQRHSDRDLVRLAQLLQSQGRKFQWLLPLTPAPFLPNGGVPVAAARTLSVSVFGVHLGVLDRADQLHKMYSFFGQKVFGAFSSFVAHLKDLFCQHRIEAPCTGALFSFMEGDKLYSYFEDHSLAFEQGFSRYLKHNFKEGIELKDPTQEAHLKTKYKEEVQELFKVTAESELSSWWQGVVDIAVLGGGPQETIERCLPHGKSQLSYVHQLYTHYIRGRWVSSCLLSTQEKGELLDRMLNHHFGPSDVERRFRSSLRLAKLTEEWRPFGLIDIYSQHEQHFINTGLIPYLEQKFPSIYGLNFYVYAQDHSSEQRLKFFFAKGMDRKAFSQMLKLFMLGHHVVLDRQGLEPELDRMLQVFFLENKIKVQSVKVETLLSLCELGDGKLIIYDGEKLHSQNHLSFWPRLFKFFNLKHLELHSDQDVFGLWSIRASSPHELNYIDVRRVHLYNPTSYKKQVIIQTKGGFAYMKMIDPSKARAESRPHGVEIELLPQGRIALDFGHYEEN